MKRLPPIVWDPEAQAPAKEEERPGATEWAIVVMLYVCIAQSMILHGLAAMSRGDYARVAVALAVIVYGVFDLVRLFFGLYRREKFSGDFPKFTPWIVLGLIIYVWL